MVPHFEFTKSVNHNIKLINKVNNLLNIINVENVIILWHNYNIKITIIIYLIL